MPFSIKNRITDLLARSTHTRSSQQCILPPYENGVVLRGFDVVEYFRLHQKGKTRAKGVKGKHRYSYSLKRGGANYIFYFKDQQNLRDFQKDPHKYIPRFGGFCSWGFANEWGELSSVPENCSECLTGWPWTREIMGPPADTVNGWSIYQGHLYFNINSTYRKLWEDNPDTFIARASRRWEQYFNSLSEGPLNVKSFPWNWKASTVLSRQQERCLQQDKTHQGA